MTSPAPVGFPDWQRTFATSRSILINDPGRVANATITYPTLTTANLESLGVFANVTATNGMLVQLLWYFDAALTMLATQDSIELRVGQTFDQSIIVKAPFCQVQVTPEPAAPSTYTLVVYEAVSQGISQRFAVDNVLIGTAAQSVGATSTVSLRPSRVWAGPATFLAYSDAATTWSVELIFERPGGISGKFIHLNQTVPVKVHQTYLPSAPVRIDLINGDASARNFIAALVAQPFHP